MQKYEMQLLKEMKVANHPIGEIIMVPFAKGFFSCIKEEEVDMLCFLTDSLEVFWKKSVASFTNNDFANFGKISKCHKVWELIMGRQSMH